MSLVELVTDGEQVAAQLEQARAARERADQIVGWLEDGVELLSGSSEPPVEEPPRAPDAPPAPASASPPGRRAAPAARDQAAKVLAAVLQANGPRSAAQIAEHAGLTIEQARPVLKRLVDDGRVVASGNTNGRRYRAGEHAYGEHRQKVETAIERSRTKEAAAVARVGIRDRVLKAIAAEPGLDIHALGQRSGLPPGDVAEACDWLERKAKITASPGGTYRRKGQAAVG